MIDFRTQNPPKWPSKVFSSLFLFSKKQGYRKRMLRIWKEIGTFDLKEQQLADQVRSIRKNSLMSEVEMEELKRTIVGDIGLAQVVL